MSGTAVRNERNLEETDRHIPKRGDTAMLWCPKCNPNDEDKKTLFEFNGFHFVCMAEGHAGI